MSKAVVVILCVSLAGIQAVHGVSVADYKELRERLLANYSTSVRPVLDQDYTLFVYVAIYLADINEVDVVRQNMLTTAYLELEWKDELLQWDEKSTGIYDLYFKQVYMNSLFGLTYCSMEGGSRFFFYINNKMT